MNQQIKSSVFITFSGNCKKALKFYQTCFGGLLQFEIFETKIEGYAEMPVVKGSLISDRINIHGSDLVHNEGRKIGNYISIFLPCKNANDRQVLADKLEYDQSNLLVRNCDDQELVEVIDAFDVRWILGI